MSENKNSSSSFTPTEEHDDRIREMNEELEQLEQNHINNIGELFEEIIDDIIEEIDECQTNKKIIAGVTFFTTLSTLIFSIVIAFINAK